MRAGPEVLTLQRIKEAREVVLAAAFLPEFYGATGSQDHQGNLIEAKRNLTALVMVLHGQQAFDDVIDQEHHEI